MKFRNAHFRGLPMSDAVKITYVEMLINEVTGQIINGLGQNVMRMTTKDWLMLPLLPLRLTLLPIAVLIAHKDVARYNNSDCTIRRTYYDNYVLYWRNYDDFATKPYKWNS